MSEQAFANTTGWCSKLVPLALTAAVVGAALAFAFS